MSLDERPAPQAPIAIIPRPPPWATVALSGDIDLVTAPDMLDRLLAAAASGERPGVVADFSYVTFIDSSGVRALERTGARLGANGQGLIVRSPSRSLLMMVELFGLPDLLGSPDSGHVDC